MLHLLQVTEVEIGPQVEFHASGEEYMGNARRMSRLRRRLAVVAVGMTAILVAGMVAAASVEASDALVRGAETFEKSGALAARQALSPKVRRQLRKAHRLLRQGSERQARRVGRRIRKRKVPMRRRNRSTCITINACQAASAASGRGCGTASGNAVYDVDVLGFDAFKPSIAQSYCWKRGKVTDLGGIALQSNLTTFGSVINIHYEGVVYSNAYWERWRGEPHGTRVLVRVLKFTGCTGIPNIGGCLFPKDWNVALALVMRGNGTFGFGSS